MTILPNQLHLSIADSTAEHKAFRRLVFAEYGKRNWLNPAHYPDGMVLDEFDDDSHTITFNTEGEVLAGMRIVPDSNLGFPHEESLGLAKVQTSKGLAHPYSHFIKETPRSKMAEITRVVSRVGHKALFFNITKSLWWYSYYRDIEVFVMVIDADFCKLGKLIGMPIYPIGEPVFCEGSETIPAITLPKLYPKLLNHPRWGWSYAADQANLDSSWAQLLSPNNHKVLQSTF